VVLGVVINGYEESIMTTSSGSILKFGLKFGFKIRFSTAGQAAGPTFMAKRNGDTHVAATRLEFHPVSRPSSTFILRHCPHFAGGWKYRR